MKQKRPDDHVGQDTWGWRFQRKRKALKLSQKTISDITGLTQQAISKFENDEVQARADTLEKYAKAVGERYEDLFHPAFRPQGRSPAARKRESARIASRRGGDR